MTDLPSYPGVPRWVKISLAVVGAVVLAAAMLMLLSGGRHGPQRHFPSGDERGPAAQSRANVSPGGGSDSVTPSAGAYE